MKGLIEAKRAVLMAESADHLQRVVDSLCSQGRYHLNPDLDYADNAIIAEMNMRYGVAELLRLAHKRRSVL